MRTALVILALTGSVFAAPSLRWLDATGGFQAADVKRVIEENGTSIEVELSPTRSEESEDSPDKARIEKIPLARVLELVREDDRDAEQKQLLEARTAVRAGVGVKEAKATLVLLAEKAREPWVREYAAAFLAIAAGKLGEGDALPGMTRFFRAYPKSRFVCEVMRERTRVESEVLTDPSTAFDAFGATFEEIGKRGGPLRVQYGCMLDAAIRNSKIQAMAAHALHKNLEIGIAEKRPDPSAAETAMRLSVGAEWAILAAGEKWRAAIAAGVSPRAFRAQLDRIEDSADILLPDTLVDLRVEQAALAVAMKQFPAADQYLVLARKQNASLVRQLLIQRTERELEAARDKEKE